MKKIYSITLAMLFMMTMASLSLDAAQCSGGGNAFVNGQADLEAHVASQNTNCCAGSTVTYTDMNTGVNYSHTTTTNGSNSSCATQ